MSMRIHVTRQFGNGASCKSNKKTTMKAIYPYMERMHETKQTNLGGIMKKGAMFALTSESDEVGKPNKRVKEKNLPDQSNQLYKAPAQRQSRKQEID
jgi:hypothetical protein